MEYEICLKNLKFYAYHGVFEEERKTGNEFIVNLNVTLPFDSRIAEDELEGTVSYASLYEIVKEVMNTPYKLLEKVTLEISKRIREEFPKLKGGEVQIEKVRPPIPEMMGSAVVKLKF